MIKSNGGVFGRNPTFNSVSVEGDISIDGQLIVSGEAITGLDYQGGWNASTNNPDIAASSPVSGQFWIVTADGSTDVGGITNWTVGDWALFDGTSWQRVEGGNTDLDTGVSGTLKVLNGGTGATTASDARTNLGLVIGTDVEPADSTILKDADIGVTVQAYDADTAKYDATTANFTGTLQEGGNNVVTVNEVGSMSAQDATDVEILGGTIDSTNIGATTPGSAAFNVADVDNIRIDGNTISSTNTNGDINITPNGTGTVNLDNYAKVGTSGAYGQIIFDSSTAAGFSTTWQSGGVNRWILQKAGAGDDLILYRYNDAGGYAGNPLLINRTNGNATFEGNIVMKTAGRGIDFSATGDAGGMTSELLDDYEEGAWTPTGFTGTIDSAYYTKVGRLVTVSAYIYSATFSGSTIGGLPFTADSAFSAGTVGYNDSTNIDSVYVQKATTTIRTVSGVTLATPNGTQIIFTASYTTAS